MFDGLAEQIEMRTGRWRLLAKQPAANIGQAVAQALAGNSIKSLPCSVALIVWRGRTSARKMEKVLPQPPRQEAAVIFGRIVAVKDAVPIQRFLLAAAWTVLLFE